MNEQKITGYRNLSQEEIDLVNELKKLGNELGKNIDMIGKMDSVDQRWLSIGRTNMQQGIMALVRAITKPDSF